MKRLYEKPMLEAERFEANEYVAACLRATFDCRIYDNGTPARGTDYVVGPDGNWHSPNCDGSFDYTSGTGAEATTGHQYSEISGANLDAVGTYNASWVSYDGAGLRYQHTGIITVSYSDSSRPNHS